MNIIINYHNRAIKTHIFGALLSTVTAFFSLFLLNPPIESRRAPLALSALGRGWELAGAAGGGGGAAGAEGGGGAGGAAVGPGGGGADDCLGAAMSLVFELLPE